MPVPGREMQSGSPSRVDHVRVLHFGVEHDHDVRVAVGRRKVQSSGAAVRTAVNRRYVIEEMNKTLRISRRAGVMQSRKAL